MLRRAAIACGLAIFVNLAEDISKYCGSYFRFPKMQVAPLPVEAARILFYLECIMRILKRGQKPAARTTIWNAVEQLEPRMLLSASAVGNPHPDLKVLPFDSSSSISGFSPAEIRKAYGFDQLSIGNGSVAADGRGQTIAIVDAFDAPTIASDLATFDSQFGIAAPPSFKIVNQTGGSTLPTPDSGWAGEISLDVEWSHAMAPGANILLIETQSDSWSDLMAGAIYARTVPSVSVVSMSWGGSEFFQFTDGGETASQASFDADFTTPTGRQGITFIAAAGDSGVVNGTMYPATSPNVLSVGGTSLFTQSDGTYLTETAWNGTSGGYSTVESEPSYQRGVQSSGVRSVPDVAYNGDELTGFAVYDSTDDGFGDVGWYPVGGTSAGSPQWAALIAIADQARVLQGQGTLDGSSQTLPLLYAAYQSPSSSQYDAYTSEFHDVQSGGGGQIHWKWGYGSNAQVATAGYDTATGLGTPRTQSVVDILNGIAPPIITGTGGSTGGPGGNQTPQVLPPSPLSGTLIGVPSAVLGSSSGKLTLRITDTGTPKFSGPIAITLVASTDATFSSDDAQMTTLMLPRVNLKQGASKNVNLKFKYPSNLADGSYYLIADVDATSTNTAADSVVSAPVQIKGPTVDLSAAFAPSSVSIKAGKTTNAFVSVGNLGNVMAAGTVTITLYSSTDQTLDASDTVITTIPGVKIRIKSGQSKKLHIHFVAPANLAAGSYNLIASINPLTVPADTNTANNVAVAST